MSATMQGTSLLSDGGPILDFSDGMLDTYRTTVEITGVTGDTPSARMHSALNASNLPAYFSPLTEDMLSLRLVRYRARKHPTDDPTMALIDLEYINYSRTAGAEGVWIVHGSTNIIQVTKSSDQFGFPITVEHTFPASDPDPQFAGQTIVQGGEYSYMVPQTTLVFKIHIRTAVPHIIADSWAGSVNAFYWAGGFPGRWLCTGTTFDPLSVDVDPPRWMFTFEFAHSIQNMQPIVSVVDPRDGRPPAGVVAGVGIKQVNAYPARDFRELADV